MNKEMNEKVKELYQYFEKGDKEKILSFLNSCQNKGLHFDDEHFVDKKVSISDKVSKLIASLIECIDQERWEECILLVENSHFPLTVSPAIQLTIDRKIKEIQLRVESLTDALKEPESSTKLKASEPESEPELESELELEFEKDCEMLEQPDSELDEDSFEVVPQQSKSARPSKEINIR